MSNPHHECAGWNDDVSKMRFHPSDLDQEALQRIGSHKKELVVTIEERRCLGVSLLANSQ